MRFVNLTPHTLNIHSDNGEVTVLQPSGTVARVTATTVEAPGYESSPFTVRTIKYGEVENLPAPEQGVGYVVSGLVRDRVPSRRDVFSPGELVRNDAGQPIGCRGLVVNS